MFMSLLVLAYLAACIAFTLEPSLLPYTPPSEQEGLSDATMPFSSLLIKYAWKYGESPIKRFVSEPQSSLVMISIPVADAALQLLSLPFKAVLRQRIIAEEKLYRYSDFVF